MTGAPRTRFLLFLLLWGLLAVPARGDELSSWFLTDRRARAYTGVQAELQGLIDEARLQNVPIGPLIDKLREGASKRVEAERLPGALRETIDRMLRARSILEQAGAADAGSEENVQAVSVLLQRGLPEELARQLIARALQAGRGMQAARAACDAVTSLLAVRAMGEQDALKVGELLLASKLPVPAYRSLVSVYLKAKASALDNSEILNDVIISTLESGGGIVSMDEKIGGRAARADAEPPESPEQPGGHPPATGPQAGNPPAADPQDGNRPAGPPGKTKSDHKKD